MGGNRSAFVWRTSSRIRLSPAGCDLLYLNGLAAIPLVNGLIGLGMSPAAGLALMTAGGITCIPAAAAMYGLLRPRTFALYLAWSVATALVSGWSYALYLAA